MTGFSSPHHSLSRDRHPVSLEMVKLRHDLRAWLVLFVVMVAPGRLAAIGGASGVVMIGLGVSLAVTGKND